jgi:glycerophosphoryl diester phosphodiesterase
VAASAKFANLPEFVISGHRGAGALESPDSSLNSLRKALTIPEINILDMDVQQLTDGTPVYLHDTTVDRVTAASGLVLELTPEQWAALRLDPDHWWLPGTPEEPVVTMEQVFDEIGGKKVMTIEAKAAAAADPLIAMIKYRGLESSVLINSNDAEVIRKVHEAGILTHLWLTAEQAIGVTDAQLREYATFANVLDIDRQTPDDDVRRALNAGFDRVLVHTVVTRAVFGHLTQDLGVKGIVSDAPLYMLGKAEYPARLIVPKTITPWFSSDGTTLNLTTWLSTAADTAGWNGLTLRMTLDGVTATGVTAQSGRNAGRVMISFPRPAPGIYTVTLSVDGDTQGEQSCLGSTTTQQVTIA